MSIPPNLQALIPVLEQLRQQTRPDGQGQVVAIAAHKTGVGTSYVARNLAMIAAHNSGDNQQVLLLDSDFQNNAQSAAFFSHEYMSQWGQPQGPYDATFGQVPLWMVTPNHAGADSDAAFVSLHTLMDTKLALTHFHWESVRERQNVMIRHAREYWHALRSRFLYTFVDVPAFDRADRTQEICAEADCTILVTPRGDAGSESVKTVYKALNDAGAHCAGLVINDKPVQGTYSGGVL